MEKVVKGATKIKLAAPKSKYIEPILSATNGGEAGVAEVFRTLELRLRDSTWTIVFKSLLVVHFMIRDSDTDATLRYIAESPRRLAISNFTDVQTQGQNIRRYSEYLSERARAYRDTKSDYIKSGSGKMKRLTIDKGLLRHVESVQSQISSLIRCDMLGTEPENDISATAFRLLVLDVLELFRTMNEGTINALEHFFMLSRPDAERALEIYKTFVKLTEEVMHYLRIARQHESATKIEVPQLRHAPTTLTNALEEYLNDPDFEINRRQYIAQQDARRNGAPLETSVSALARLDKAFPEVSKTTSHQSQTAPSQPPRPNQAAAKGPPGDLLDFFESIGQNQQTMGQPAPQAYTYGAQAPAQQTGLNPFFNQSFQQQPQFQMQPQMQAMQMQQNFSGGYGGYPAQQQQPQFTQNSPYGSNFSSTPQNGMPDFGMQNQQQFQPQQQQQQQPVLQPQQTSSNPFRQSMMMSQPAQQSPINTGVNRQSTNPFARNNISSPIHEEPSQPQTQSDDFANNSAIFNTTSPPPGGLQPQKTGTNPFAKAKSPPPGANSTTQQLKPSVTGTTNPFRQSAFVNQQTGHGWQYSSQGNLGGWDMNNVDTISVFPRPGQQSAQQGQQYQYQ